VSKVDGSRLERVISVIMALSVVAVAIVAIYKMLGSESGGEVRSRLTRSEWNALSSTGTLWGSPEADVRVVVFVDYECPFCRSLQNAIERLLDEGPTRFAVRIHDYPLTSHPGALQAALVAYCAQEIPYSSRARALYGWQDSAFAPDARALLASLGTADTADLRSCIDTIPRGHFGDSVRAIGAALKVTATPTVIVDRDILRRPPTEDELRDRLRRER